MERTILFILLLSFISSVVTDAANLPGRNRRSKQMKVARQGKRNLVLFNKIESTPFKPKDEKENFFYLKYDSDQISPRNLKPYFNSKTPKFQSLDRTNLRTLEPVHHAKLITIKNYNSITKPNLPHKTVSSSAVQFTDSGDRQTKLRGNLIVAKNKNPSIAIKRERKDSVNLSNGKWPSWKLSKKKKFNKKEGKKEINDNKPDKMKKPKKQGSKKFLSNNSGVRVKNINSDSGFKFHSSFTTPNHTPVPVPSEATIAVPREATITVPSEATSTVPREATMPRFVFREPPAFV